MDHYIPVKCRQQHQKVFFDLPPRYTSRGRTLTCTRHLGPMETGANTHECNAFMCVCVCACVCVCVCLSVCIVSGLRTQSVCLLLPSLVGSPDLILQSPPPSLSKHMAHFCCPQIRLERLPMGQHQTEI